MKELLKKLIKAQSTPEKGEFAAAKVAAEYLNKFGISTQIDNWETTRANFIAKMGSAGRKGLLFLCHLDVVPTGGEKWRFEPFEGIEAEGKIFGRGATDMKGPLAALLAAAGQIAKERIPLRGELIIAATAGEETDSCGIKRFLEKNAAQLPALAGCVVAEPTDFQAVTAHRGILWLEITTKGKAAHGSMPQLGINAINNMNLLLNRLGDYEVSGIVDPLLNRCSMSINRIFGGKATNIVPDSCSIQVDIRTIPQQSHQEIIADFGRIFAEIKSQNPDFQADLAVLRDVKAMKIDSDCDFVRGFIDAVGIKETKAVGFTTDGPFLAGKGWPVVIFGPGKPQICHQPDEFIEISELETAVKAYKKIILKFLG